MCNPRRDMDENEFKKWIYQEAVEQRLSDSDKRTIEDVRPDAGYRPKATLCLAYSRKDGYLYVGYSGGAGGMMYRGGISNTEQSMRRRDRLSNAGLNVLNDINSLGHTICNCAEAWAASIALSYGVPIKDLFFASFFKHGGTGIVNPCLNCLSWIVGNTSGYLDDRYDFKCDGGCGNGGTGGGFGGGGGGLGGGSGVIAN